MACIRFNYKILLKRLNTQPVSEAAIMRALVIFSFSICFLSLLRYFLVGVSIRKMQEQKDFVDKMDIVQILEENYRTSGTSDADALVAIYDDIEAGYFVSTLEEWGITESELRECVRILRKKMNLVAEVY